MHAHSHSRIRSAAPPPRTHTHGAASASAPASARVLPPRPSPPPPPPLTRPALRPRGPTGSVSGLPRARQGGRGPVKGGSEPSAQSRAEAGGGSEPPRCRRAVPSGSPSPSRSLSIRSLPLALALTIYPLARSIARRTLSPRRTRGAAPRPCRWGWGASERGGRGEKGTSALLSDSPRITCGAPCVCVCVCVSE